MKDYYYIKVEKEDSYEILGYWSCFDNVTQAPELIKFYDDLDQVAEAKQQILYSGYIAHVRRL